MALRDLGKQNEMKDFISPRCFFLNTLAWQQSSFPGRDAGLSSAEASASDCCSGCSEGRQARRGRLGKKQSIINNVPHLKKRKNTCLTLWLLGCHRSSSSSSSSRKPLSPPSSFSAHAVSSSPSSSGCVHPAPAPPCPQPQRPHHLVQPPLLPLAQPPLLRLGQPTLHGTVQLGPALANALK